MCWRETGRLHVLLVEDVVGFLCLLLRTVMCWRETGGGGVPFSCLVCEVLIGHVFIPGKISLCHGGSSAAFKNGLGISDGSQA